MSGALDTKLAYVDSKRQIEQHPDNHYRGKRARNFAGSERLDEEDDDEDCTGDANNSGGRDFRIQNSNAILPLATCKKASSFQISTYPWMAPRIDWAGVRTPSAPVSQLPMSELICIHQQEAIWSIWVNAAGKAFTHIDQLKMLR